MSFSKIKTLLLYAKLGETLSYYEDWKDAFTSAVNFEVDTINICLNSSLATFNNIQDDYDFIVIVHSSIGDTLKYISPFEEALLNRKSKLLIFVANEYNIPLPFTPISHKIQFIKNIRADFIGTQLCLDSGAWLYGDCKGSKVVALPHALNKKDFKPGPNFEKREYDIRVIANKYLPYLGDDERSELLQYFQNYKFKRPLKMDINNSHRLNREGWANFLGDTKATLSTEAGSYYLERDDHTVHAIGQYVRDEIKSGKRAEIQEPDLVKKVSKGIKELLVNNLSSYKNSKYAEFLKGSFEINFVKILLADADKIQEQFFSNYKPTEYNSKCISSRHFDAIGTKTIQIMLEGRFNDILKADVHYIKIEKDFSNIADVAERLSDFTFLNDMANLTYEYILDQHTATNRLQYIETLLS